MYGCQNNYQSHLSKYAKLRYVWLRKMTSLTHTKKLLSVMPKFKANTIPQKIPLQIITNLEISVKRNSLYNVMDFEYYLVDKAVFCFRRCHNSYLTFSILRFLLQVHSDQMVVRKRFSGKRLILFAHGQEGVFIHRRTIEVSLI